MHHIDPDGLHLEKLLVLRIVKQQHQAAQDDGEFAKRQPGLIDFRPESEYLLAFSVGTADP